MGGVGVSGESIKTRLTAVVNYCVFEGTHIMCGALKRIEMLVANTLAVRIHPIILLVLCASETLTHDTQHVFGDAHLSFADESHLGCLELSLVVGGSCHARPGA